MGFFTAAELIGGLILRDPAGADRTDVTPTAADIVGAITNATVGTSFEYYMKNNADDNENLTISAGSGVSLVNNDSINIGKMQTGTYLVVITNVTAGSEAVSIYWLGTQGAS